MERPAPYETSLNRTAEPALLNLNMNPTYWEVRVLDKLAKRYIRTRFWQKFIRRRLLA